MKSVINKVHFNADDQSVTLPEGFKEAYEAFCENGFNAIAMNPEHGGVGAPFAVACAAQEAIAAANKSFSMCPGLSSALVEALEAHASEELVEAYVPKLVSGEWTGTMCLTSLMPGPTLACSPQPNPMATAGQVTGTKVWITFGEHNLTDNIIHLVLARLPDALRASKESVHLSFQSLGGR